MWDEHHAPIAFDRARRSIHYTEPTYRLPQLQMSQGERLADERLRPGTYHPPAMRGAAPLKSARPQPPQIAHQR
jgi:hypothetical protein